MLRFSLFAMLLLFPSTAILSLELITPPEYEICETGKRLDLAIVGKGFFQLYSPKDQQQHLTRSGRLGLDEYGQFIVRIGNQEYLLDPPLSCPNDSKDIRFNQNGTVDALCNDEWVQIGHIQMVRLRDGVQLSKPLNATPSYEYFVADNAFITEPGFDGSGYLRQGYRETCKLWLPHRIVGIIFFGILAICWRWRQWPEPLRGKVYWWHHWDQNRVGIKKHQNDEGERMRKALVFVAICMLFLGGCAAIRNAILPGDSELDKSRRFLDQTSDNPYR